MAELSQKRGPALPSAPEAPVPRPRRRTLVLGAAALLVLVVGPFLLWQWWRMEAQADRMTALALVEQNHFADAEPRLLRALDRDPGDLPVVKALALGRFTAGPIAEAEPYLIRWSQLEPDSVQPWKLRMEMNARLFRREEALSDGLHVLELEPDNDSVRRNVVWMLIAVGRLDEAKNEARTGLNRLPQDSEFHYLLAQILHLKGEVTASANELDLLLKLHPGYVPGLLLRGKLYCESNQPRKALGPLRRVVAESPDPKDRQAARYHLAQALAQCGQTREADALMRQFKRYVEADRLFSDSEQQPDNRELHVKAATALIETGQAEKGVRLLMQLLKRAPDCAAAHRVLAGFFESQGQAALAEQHRRLAVASH